MPGKFGCVRQHKWTSRTSSCAGVGRLPSVTAASRVAGAARAASVESREWHGTSAPGGLYLAQHRKARGDFAPMSAEGGSCHARARSLTRSPRESHGFTVHRRAPSGAPLRSGSPNRRAAGAPLCGPRAVRQSHATQRNCGRAFTRPSPNSPVGWLQLPAAA